MFLKTIKIFVSLFLFLCSVFTFSLYAIEPLPADLVEVGITEKLNTTLPLDLSFIDENNNQVTLDDIYSNDKPAIFHLVYYSCPMLCNLVLTGFTNTLKDLDPDFFNKFNIITISIDPADTPESAKLFKGRYVSQINVPDLDESWHFLSGNQNSIDAITNAFGFSYKFNENTQEFAHNAALFFTSKDAVISRYLYGIQFDVFDFRLAILESSNKTHLSTVEKVLLFCYNYNPQSNQYSILAVSVMRISAALTVVFLVLLILFLVYRYK